ncbi:MAG: response regulator [Desulfocapsa sp.]|nr:response regulator [Desulfocapsa sp.]
MKKHLLIVEDENLILYSLVTVLQSDSVQVTTAANGANALKEITVFPHYDLYIVDLTLPDMNGEELIKKIRRNQPLAKVIILTGRFLNKQAMLDNMRSAAELEPFHFICKPFDIEEIQEVVFQALFS